MKPIIQKNKNGSKFLIIPNKNVETVNVMILTKAGSRMEDESALGIAHFLEHMVFKGTVLRPTAQDINLEIESLGAAANAFTSHEYTGYYIHGNKKHIDKYLKILSDVYFNSIFPKEEIVKEKGVVVEEIKMYREDHKSHATKIFFNLAFKGSPFARPILGTEKTVNSFTQQDLLNFRQKNYRSENLLVAMAGNVDSFDCLSLLTAAFDFKEPRPTLSQPDSKIPPTFNVRGGLGVKVAIEKRKIDQTHLRLGFKTVDIYSKLNPVAHVINALIGSGMGSIMFSVLREKNGYAYYTGSSNISFSDAGVLMIYAGVAKDKLCDSIKIIMEELKNITTKGVKYDDLKRAKEYIKGGLFMDLESSSSLNQYYAFDLLLKEKIESPTNYAKKIDLVSNSDIKSFMSACLAVKNISLAVVGDVANKSELSFIINNF